MSDEYDFAKIFADAFYQCLFENKNSNLYLIGTCHGDPKGKERLNRALNRLNPDILTIEYNDEAYNSKKPQIKELVNVLENAFYDVGLGQEYQESKEAFNQSINPFELDVLKNYSIENNIPLHYIDSKEGTIKNYDRMIAEFHNVILLLKQRPEVLQNTLNVMKTGNQNSDLVYGDKLVNFGLENSRQIFQGRDSYQASKLNELVKENPKKRIVHVGGLLHMVKDHLNENLYSILTNNFGLKPEVKRLNEY
ncbi:hypothetical protein KY334_03910 [Candidatus Woesearchaeota archaeon]|nr:hypothetical protein [Candidatus Woesearchaeota archaeon]